MLIPMVGLLTGIVIGILCPFVFPASYSTYVAIGILACADSVLGGVRSNLFKQFTLSVFVSGFFGNAILAMLLIFLGQHLNIQLSVAAVVVFGSRLFQNFADIRRFWLNKGKKEDNMLM
ncbi:MAG: small basic family protein [Lachnospiraceae bacterium]|nr:small basic family protein [Lachnospiraceae bacterium]